MDEEGPRPGGWSIQGGILKLYGLNTKGERYEVLTVPLWDADSGAWLVDTADIIE